MPNQELENVDQFRRLGYLVTKEAYCTNETISLAEMAKGDLTIFLTGNLSSELRKTLIKLYTWSTAIHGT